MTEAFLQLVYWLVVVYFAFQYHPRPIWLSFVGFKISVITRSDFCGRGQELGHELLSGPSDWFQTSDLDTASVAIKIR